jgi:hypothetical protein
MLKIVRNDNAIIKGDIEYGRMLQNLAIAEANCMKQNSKALSHFIAIVKEIEKYYGFTFQTYTEEDK